MIQIILRLLFIIGAGILFRRVPGMPDADQVRRIIGAIVLNVFLPALTLSVLAEAPITDELWAIPLVSWSCIGVCGGLAWIVYAYGGRRRLERPTIGALLLAAIFCNATYLGLPVVTAAVGEAYGHVPIVFDLLAMSPALFTIGVMIGVEYGEAEGQHSLAQGLKQVVRMPPFIAAVTGLLLNVGHVPIWDPLQEALQTMGKAVSPLMMFSVGLALRPVRLSTLPRLGPAIAIKLAAAPVVAWGVITLTAMIDPSIWSARTTSATLLEAGMPTMMLTMVFAERYKLDTNTLAQVIVVSTVLAMLTLPMVAGL